MVERINSSAEVIESLGGPAAVAKLIGNITPNAVGNWKVRGLPPETFVVLTQALNAKGFYAPPSLWRMYEGAAATS